MLLINQFDFQITRFIALTIPHNILTDYFFAFLSLKGNSIIVWALILLLLIIFEENRNKKFMFFFFMSFVLTSVINNNLLKNLFQRPRPIFHFTTPLACPTDFGMPSGHAAAAFAAAVIFAHFDPKRRWIYYVVAGLVGLSRIYLGCHYFLDVVVGAIVGSLISYLFIISSSHSSPSNKTSRGHRGT